MTTREKILVGMMGLAIVYGAYELFWAPATRKSPRKQVTASSDDTRGFAVEVSQKLANEKIPDDAVYRIEKAATGWTKDPFLQTTTPLSEEKQADPAGEPAARALSQGADFVYSGYLQLGDRKMAVINGMEYAVGESLGVDDLYVKAISSQQVVLGSVKGQQTIRLPLFENNTDR